MNSTENALRPTNEPVTPSPRHLVTPSPTCLLARGLTDNRRRHGNSGRDGVDDGTGDRGDEEDDEDDERPAERGRGRRC